MQRAALGSLADLLLATEAVGDNERVGFGLAHCWQQRALATGERDIAMLAALEAEGTGHAAAAWLRHVEVKAHLFQQRGLILHTHDRFVVAVTVDQRLAMKRRGLVSLD
ncbi:MAG: hypothetical protein M3082_12245, partial [Candidatus Dormibacteraeota bacterium]|nr:hypothetical protein [Candidatus Dormibacteraeota bacterium]